MSQTAAAIGIHGFWGLSATFDCQEAFSNIPTSKTTEKGSTEGAPSETLRVLLVHTGDVRHILSTVTRRLRSINMGTKKPPAVHFYLLESPMEVLARDLAMWELFLDFEIPIRQRANLFLEVFGNAKVQDRTSRYLDRLGAQLTDIVVKHKSTLNVIDLQHLKYRDKDELEFIFRSYSRETVFDTTSLRDQRMRGYYAERFDSRRALYDWDWQYGLRETASIIHIRLFRDWRETGIAFE